MSGEILVLKPELREYIWGGTKLKTEYGYDIPSDTTGECWAISAHKSADCQILGGKYDGKTLSELWDTKKELFGNMKGDRFPLLVKIIDAKDNLSVQVHPDDAYAAEHENGALGKSECWYILDCEPNSTIVIGHHAKTKDELVKMISDGDWEHFLRVIPIKKGDFFQIDAGCLHAIQSGTLILETQQNSDITYRVYDYGRLQNGKPRQLHVQQSIDCIKAPFDSKATAGDIKTEKLGGAIKTHYVDTKNYSLDRYEINGECKIPAGEYFTNVSILSGEGEIDGMPIKKGMHLVLTAGYKEAVVKGNVEIMVSYPVVTK